MILKKIRELESSDNVSSLEKIVMLDKVDLEEDYDNPISMVQQIIEVLNYSSNVLYFSLNSIHKHQEASDKNNRESFKSINERIKTNTSVNEAQENLISLLKEKVDLLTRKLPVKIKDEEGNEVDGEEEVFITDDIQTLYRNCQNLAFALKILVESRDDNNKTDKEQTDLINELQDKIEQMKDEAEKKSALYEAYKKEMEEKHKVLDSQIEQADKYLSDNLAKDKEQDEAIQESFKQFGDMQSSIDANTERSMKNSESLGNTKTDKTSKVLSIISIVGAAAAIVLACIL